jgi:hypothetical protein
MEIVDVIATAHFSDTRVGAVSRKQKIRIAAHLAEELFGLGLIQYANPLQAAPAKPSQTEALAAGGDESPASLPAAPALETKIAKRSYKKKTGDL